MPTLYPVHGGLSVAAVPSKVSSQVVATIQICQAPRLGTPEPSNHPIYHRSTVRKDFSYVCMCCVRPTATREALLSSSSSGFASGDLSMCRPRQYRHPTTDSAFVQLVLYVWAWTTSTGPPRTTSQHITLFHRFSTRIPITTQRTYTITLMALTESWNGVGAALHGAQERQDGT